MGSRDVELDLIGHDHTGHATRSAANNLDQLRRKLAKFDVDTDSNLKRRFTASGLRAASAFAQSFTRVISGGLLGRGSVGMAAKMNPVFATLGALAAVTLGAKLLAVLGDVILAGLPLVLGPAIAAIPFVHLFKTQEKAVAQLKAKWSGFVAFISKPMKLPFLDTLKEVGSGLDRLRKPFATLVKALGPALAPFTKGVFDGIVDFVKALEPAMPGITAGLKEWGKQMPKIGKALGDMFAKILGDPGKVEKAVKDISGIIQGLFDFIAGAVNTFVAIGDGMDLAFLSIETAAKGMALAVMGAITDVLDGLALLNPAWAGVAAAAHLKLFGMQQDFKKTSDKWAATQQAIAKRVIVAKIEATITDLETKIAAAKAKLKTVHGKKARAKIEATIKDLEAKAAAAKRKLAQVQGTRTQAKIKAEIHDLQTKVANAKAKLKTVHNAKTQAKIRAEISQLQAAAARARAELASIRGKTVTVNLRTVKTITTRRVATGANPKSIPLAVKSAGPTWAGAAGGSSYRTGGPRVVLGDTNVDSRVFIDGRELRAMARSTVVDETRRNAHRARVGRR